MLLLAAALSVSAAPIPQTSLTNIAAACPAMTPHIAVQRGRAPPLRKLNELPPANLYAAVYRRVDGCEVPIVVRYDIGKR